MPKITQTVSRLSQRALTFVIEDVSSGILCLIFVLAVIGFGIAYTLLTPRGDGIGQNFKPLSDITLFTGIYFSIVTISSLGYGDMHPMGFSKVLICVEVLLGLAIIGILIAKVTSRRLSYHVSRLFSFEAQKRLEDFATQFDTVRGDLDAIMPKLATVYRDIPNSESSSSEDKVTLISDFQKIISDFQSRCIELRDYFSDEIAQEKNYFQIAPASAMVRVGNAVDGTFLILGLLITSLSEQARAEIFLNGHNRQAIFQAINSQKQVCNLVDQNANDKETREVFQRIEETCKGIPASYFSVPEVPRESQPDQVLKGTDEPQQFSGVDNEHTDSP